MGLLSAQQVEALKSVLSASITEISADVLKEHLTDALLTDTRNRTVALLLSLKLEQLLPSDVSYTAVRVYGYESGKLDLILPYRLQLAFAEDYPDIPRYSHNHACCRFLAHGLGRDLYYCDKHAKTVISRWSDEPQDYSSGIHLAKKSDPLTEPLALAYCIAQEDGFLPCQAWTKMVRSN